MEVHVVEIMPGQVVILDGLSICADILPPPALIEVKTLEALFSSLQDAPRIAPTGQGDSR